MESLLQGYVGYSSMVMAKKLRELGGGSVRVPVSHGTIWRFRAHVVVQKWRKCLTVLCLVVYSAEFFWRFLWLRMWL